MGRFILESSATATWHRAVTEAATRAEHSLDEARESYLVFLLMRYLRRPEMVRAVLAARFLEALQEPRRRRREQLQEVGDHCLIFAGLFPEQADRRRVRLSYFVDLGRTAYGDLAAAGGSMHAELFRALAVTFAPLADVLRALREDREAALMTALEAAERSLQLDSRLARRELRTFTDATPAPAGETRH